MLTVGFGIRFVHQWHAPIGEFTLDLDCYQIPLSAPVRPYLTPTAHTCHGQHNSQSQWSQRVCRQVGLGWAVFAFSVWQLTSLCVEVSM